MIKVKDGYAKLIGTTYLGSASRVLLSNGGDHVLGNANGNIPLNNGTVSTNLNADMLDGLHIHTGRNNEVNKVVRTDASGYILAGWINTTSGDMGTTAATRIYCSNDGYIRYKTPANFFETLANDGNQISITVGSQNRKLTVNYATTSGRVIINLHTSNNTEYPIIWTNSNNTTNAVAADLFKSYSHLTYNPSARRIISGQYLANNSSGPHFTAQSTTGNWAFMRLNNSTCYWDIATTNSSSYVASSLWLGRYNGGNTGIVITTGGNVGIGTGTTAPADKLHVNGGYIRSTANSKYIRIGTENSSHTHYTTDASISHWFNKRVDVNGAIWRYNTNYGIDSDGKFYAHTVYANRSGSGTAGGVSLYSNSDPMTYGIASRNTADYGTHGYVTGDWATYLTMSNTSNRGWIFRTSDGTRRLSINAQGHLYANGLVNADRFNSRVATGTLPYACTSTTCNTNLNADLLDGKHASAFALASHGVHWEGFTKRANSNASWGTLIASNGYTPLFWLDSTTSGGVAFSDKGGQTFMQIDGYFYQNEGKYRVTDVTETVTDLGTSGNNLTWTKNGTTNNITIPYASSAGALGTYSIQHFMTYDNGNNNYLAASFTNENFSKKAAEKYIEYWDSAGGWFNSRWGLVLAISGFHRVGSSDSYVLLGGGGHKLESNLSVNYANSAGNADTVDNLHASDFVRAYGTFGTSYSYDSDWGLSIVTFDPVVSGTAPAQNPNISILNIGNAYYRRKQLAFTYSTNDIYYRRRVDSSWSGWVRLAISGESYTKSESDSRFINASGDTMTGTLYIGDSKHYLQYYTGGKYVELYNVTAATGIGVWDTGEAKVFNSKGLYKIWHEGNDGSGSGLDADLLDGYHEYSFLRYRDLGSNGGATLWSQIGIRSYHNALPEGLSGLYNYGQVVSLPGSGSRLDIFTNHVGSSESGGLGGLWWRSGWNDDKRTWRRIIDSGNIANLSVNYATSAGTSSNVVVNNSDANSTYRMVWHSGNTLYGTNNIYCNPSADLIYSAGFRHVSYNSASYLLRSDGGAAGFHWSGLGGQPTWLWGGNSQHTYYVYNPSNFNVNSAAVLRGNASNPNNSHPGHGAKVFYSWNTGQANNASSGYSNGITIGSHPNDTAYGFQIVQNMWDDRTYTRRYNGGWLSWKTLAWTSDIPNPANYYWANIRVSASSSTGTLPTFNTCWTSNWFRSTSATGWYNETYLGGIHMLDSTWVRTYNGKSFYCSAVILAGNRIYTGYDSGEANSISCSNWFRSSGISGWYNPTYGCHVYPNNINTYGGLVLRGTKNGYHGFILGENTNYMNLMDNSNDKGLYQEGKSWILYYNRGYNRVGLLTSSLAGYAVTTGGDVYIRSGWVRTEGATGWYNESYGGGMYMEDSTWVRVYGGRKFYVSNSEYSAIHSAGGVYVAGAVHSYANLLKSTCNSRTISIGSLNSSFCHYSTDAPAHWFNTSVLVQGHVYGGSSYNRRLAYVDELPTNSWRGVENVLTSTSTSNSLTANMGRVLANGASDRPIVLLAGTLYRSGASSSYTTWYFTGYRHRSISSSNPTVYVSGGVARFYFTNASGYGFSFAQVCANHQASGEATGYQSGEYQTRSSGLFWFGTYAYGSYLYIRAIALGDRNNDTAESYKGMWTNYSDGVTRVSIIAVGYAW